MVIVSFAVSIPDIRAWNVVAEGEGVRVAGQAPIEFLDMASR